MSKINIEKIIGAKIKEYRVMAGITQSDLASHVGITFQQFQKYESGVNKVSASRLYVLSKILGVSINDFFENDLLLTDSVNEKKAVYNENSSRGALELFKLYKNIKSQKAKQSLLDVAKALINQA